jgi:hypothetical protein
MELHFILTYFDFQLIINSLIKTQKQQKRIEIKSINNSKKNKKEVWL